MASSVHVLINEKSGGCEGRCQEIESAFRARSIPCAITPLHRGIRLADLRLQPGTIVVAAGGDGTVNAVASLLAGSSICMGVLALGTLNHFAKDLHLPLALEEAVGAMIEGVPRAVDVGEVNGQIFVNNSSLGFYPGMVLQRERLKKAGLNKWLSLMIASFRAFVSFRHISICLTLPGNDSAAPPRRIERTTPFLFVGNNEYSMEGTSAGSRERLDGGRLYLYLAPGATRLSLLKLTIAALRGKASDAAHFESFCVDEFTVDLKRRVAQVAVDGELRRIPGRLHYKIRPATLHVMAPQLVQESAS